MAQRAEDRVGTEVTVLVEQAEDDDFECTGRADHQAPEVDGECVLERGTGLLPGELVRCVVTGTEGADLLVAPREMLRARRRRGDRSPTSGGPRERARRRRPTPRRGCRRLRAPANIANVLTGVRLVLVPVFLAALFVDHGRSVDWRLAAFGVFAVAAFTDRLDGELARRRGLVTAFGKRRRPDRRQGADRLRAGRAVGARLSCPGGRPS